VAVPNGRDATAPLWRVLGLLEHVHKSGAGYEGSCPGPRHKHADKRPSLNVGVGLDGRVLLNCKAGCSSEEVLAALNLDWSDLFEKSSAGNTIRRFNLGNGTSHVREDRADGKIIRWESNGRNGLNGTRTADLPLYRASDLAERTGPVIVTEGEKAAQALYDAGLLAVGTVTGAAGTPSESSLAGLQGREVWLWPDNDDQGREHMARIAERIKPAPRWIDWSDAPLKGDAADYLERGLPADGIKGMLRQSPVAVQSSGPRLSVVRMSDVQPEPIEWHWRGRFARGKPTLLMGDPGLGKSLITHWLAAHTSRGGNWPDGGTCEAGPTILFTIEDGLSDTVAPRLLAANARMDQILAVRGVIEEKSETTQSERMFALTQHLELLERLIVETGAVVVVMDPITAYLGPDINSHKEADVRAVLGPLQLLAERTRVVLIMVMHLNKGTGVTALYRATGSIAFPAVARVVLGVAPDPNDDDGKRRLLLPVKMNIGKLPEGIGYHIETAHAAGVLPTATESDQPPVLVWDLEPVTIDATAAMDRNGTVTELGACAEVKSALVQILGSGRVPARECERQLKEAGCSTSPTTITRAKKEMGVKTIREGFGSGGTWWWELAQTFAKTLSYGTNEPMEPMESMNAPKNPKGIEDYKDSMALTRARENLCKSCGRGWDVHGSRDPISCQWKE
jgi:putative DNA primase/helicase